MPTESDRAGPTRWLSATGWLGAALGTTGAVLLFVGWLGVSGESVVALQLPYLASASIPGAALVVAGAALLAGESARRSAADAAEMVATLYDLLTEASTPPPPDVAGDRDDHTVRALTAGTRYHRRDCALVLGKADAQTVDAATIRARALRPCTICEPPTVDE